MHGGSSLKIPDILFLLNLAMEEPEDRVTQMRGSHDRKIPRRELCFADEFKEGKLVLASCWLREERRAHSHWLSRA